MKKVIFCLFVFFVFSFFPEHKGVFAQSFPQPYARSTAEIADRYPHIVKVNVLSPFVLTINGAYEHFINAKVSVQLGAYYTGISLDEKFLWFNVPYARYRSFAITPEFRYYTGSVTRPKLNGFYVAPFLRYQNIDIRITPELQKENDQSVAATDTYEGNLSSIRIGAVGGYKFIIGERLSLEIFAGPSVRLTNWLNANINTYSAEDFLPFGFALRSGVTLGYVF